MDQSTRCSVPIEKAALDCYHQLASCLICRGGARGRSQWGEIPARITGLLLNDATDFQFFPCLEDKAQALVPIRGGPSRSTERVQSRRRYNKRPSLWRQDTSDTCAISGTGLPPSHFITSAAQLATVGAAQGNPMSVRVGNRTLRR